MCSRVSKLHILIELFKLCYGIQLGEWQMRMWQWHILQHYESGL